VANTDERRDYEPAAALLERVRGERVKRCEGKTRI
jgi:hypothetical protein